MRGYQHCHRRIPDLLKPDKLLSALHMRTSTNAKANTIRLTRPRAGAWLKLRVHLDAFLLAPFAYLRTTWWRICGKRVRARAHFAPLLAASPRAYALWLEAEPELVTQPSGHAPIVAVIDARDGDSDALKRTIDSLVSEDLPYDVARGTENAMSKAEFENAAHTATSDGWLMPLTAGDILAPGAAASYRAAIKRLQSASSAPAVTVIYADDDIRLRSGRRITPHFKPNWNAELFRHFDYLTGACIIRANVEDAVSVNDDEDWQGRLVRSAVDRGMRDGCTPIHWPGVLHHRRRRRPPTLLSAEKPASEMLPTVTVIVPTRNRVDLLRTCLNGLARTDYPGLDVIVVDNGSDDAETLTYLAEIKSPSVRIIRSPGPFNFSTLNNQAAAEANGELLCLLNNDIEIIQPNWLQLMAAKAVQDDVGAVGARLLYPDGRIQHAGVVLGICGGAAHAHRLLSPEEPGYFRRHALPQYVSAVTAACLVVRRDRFEAVGGLDEANFAVAFNDVDLCLRLNQRGWQSFYEPRATLIHHESVSRGFDKDPTGAARLAKELAALKRLWKTDEEVDTFHHPYLNRFSERFVVQL